MPDKALIIRSSNHHIVHVGRFPPPQSPFISNNRKLRPYYTYTMV